MDDAFYNLVSLDKTRGRLTKKKRINVLILMTIAALFVTSTAACAGSNARINDSPLPTTTMTTSSSNGSSNSNISPLITMRMLDKTHGWSLTLSSILKTADGGLHWQDVTPANANLKGWSTGDFLNDQDAWVVTTQEDLCSIRILYTTNGGKSWQSSTIPTTLSAGTGMPHFLNPSDGWFQAFGEPGAGNLPSGLFRTTDGGRHWKQLVEAYQGNGSNAIEHVGDVFFSDVQNGWMSGDSPFAMNPAQPQLEVTHDGGQIWYGEQLPMISGVGNNDIVDTMPPVFFGKNGLLSVLDQDITPPGSSSVQGIGLDLYVTHDRGQTWTPTKFLTVNGYQGMSASFTVYAADMSHVWAAIGTDLYATSDGGQSWTKLPPLPRTISELRFMDSHSGWALGQINTATDNNKNQPPNLLHTIDSGRTWQPINYSIVGKSTATLVTVNGSVNNCSTFFGPEG